MIGTTFRRVLGVALPSDLEHDGPVPLAAYQRAVRTTDRLPVSDLSVPILGLFGEIGSLLTVLKKKHRDANAYATYKESIVEELGDVLWYLTCVANRAGLDLGVLAQRVFRELVDWDEVQPEFGTWGDLQRCRSPGPDRELWRCMGELAELAGELVGDLRSGKIETNRDALSGDLVALLRALVTTAEVAEADLDVAAQMNLEKIFSRWPLKRIYPSFDDLDLPMSERLPRQFEVVIRERDVNGNTYVEQERNGIIIGDRLTDNKRERDDYRFHDVFHIAYAVHLGWSPVLRALFRAKRKSRPDLDESEDGARAILIEEGIATFIFGRAVNRKLFDGLDHLDYDLLKLVQEFVRGFEPEHCAPWQWEQAILDGFKLFRALKKYRGGRVWADLETHTLRFDRLTTEAERERAVVATVSPRTTPV